MKKKIISALIIILVIGAFVLNHIISYAKTAENTLYVNLAKTDLNNIGYGIGNPNNAGKYIWNINTYNTINVDEIAKQRNLYCVNADYGQTWFTDQRTDEKIAYNLNYDIQNAEDINKLQSYIDSETDGDEIIKALIQTGEDGIYEQLLWLFDNMYIKDSEATTENQINENILTYLENQLGIRKSEYEGTIGYESEENDYGEGVVTEEDIIAIQKMAIWYFTNGKDEDGEPTIYDKTKEADTQWLNITTDGGTTYNGLGKAGVDGRNKMAMDLYNHLITKAKEADSKYTSANEYKISTIPANVDVSGLQKQNDEYILNSTRKEENYLIGPIVIRENNDKKYDIKINITGEGNSTIDYEITDASGEKINYEDDKDLVGIENGFYIKIERNTIKRVNVEISISYKNINKTLWLKGTEGTDGDIEKIDNEQPLVEITEDPEEQTIKLTSKPEEFDLALRKYITKVNGVELNSTETRVPNISFETLQNGTTATYNHRKDPVVVEDGDIVTYTIAIYNEGTNEGYAKKIIDQLPTGLISAQDKQTIKIKSKDKNGNEKNTYNVTYDLTTLNGLNQIILEIDEESEIENLKPYTKNELDYETIEISCKVVQTPHSENQIILTNVAWIQEAYDAERQKIITTKETGEDRDSAPGYSPNVNKDNMSDYKGNKNNQEDLANSDYFYKGEQDDDDFEKLVIEPVKKKFDLALFKFIAAVSKDPNIEDGEYITSNKNKDGKYTRAPEVISIDSETGEIEYKEHNKEALLVEKGDYVLYTIRVYNEGEIDGYVNKIKDTLPIGLEYVELDDSDLEYSGIWDREEIDEDGREIMSTSIYSEENGAEPLKALVKDGQITDDNPDYIDVQMLCRVSENVKDNRVLVNYAQISEDSDDDIDSTPDEWIEGDDDQDYERIQVQNFDLALRKFITEVQGNKITTREPNTTITNGKVTYTHPKDAITVHVGDVVIYTLRIYNEGEIDGYAKEITDDIPEYLQYLPDETTNVNYKWKMYDKNGNETKNVEEAVKVKTDYLSKENGENNLLKAFDGTNLSYKDIKIAFEVKDPNSNEYIITNHAQISDDEDKDGKEIRDIDSTPDEWIEGEDDQDIENIKVEYFDLALRKFITEVQENKITTREPEIKIENGKVTYTHPKDAITVHVGDVVIYTLRIYNEGGIDGYAKEITDDIPEYLQYLPDETTNVNYKWKMYDKNGNETKNVEEAVKVKTDYLSKENGENNLLKAFDGTNLSYKDIKIAFEVKDPNSNEYIITNHAQISDDEDKDGNEIRDIDSTPDEWIEGEDDQDIENIKVEYFDLSLLKFVSRVILIEDGKENITETGYNGHEDPEPIIKVELHKKKINDVVVKFEYGITITNEGDIPGYATEITDYVPQGLKFVASDNQNWTDEGNNVISTKQLENTLLQPGESKTVKVILTWINGSDNLALKTNIAEISEDKNEYDVPDRDSTPDNRVEGEDDQDLAKVILAITTGTAKTYFTLTLGLLGIILVGVVLIKKFVI